MKKILLIFAIALISIVIYMFFINTNGFKTVEDAIAIQDLPDSFDDFKIVQFSDLLIGSTKTVEDLDSITEKINNLKPDLIVFTGDLIARDYNITEEEIEIIKEKLSLLDCSLYKYAVIGDNDEANLDLYKEIINDSGFILLDDQSTYIFYGDVSPIKLTGITDIDKLDSALYLADELDTVYNIVLTHKPDNIDIIAEKQVDLVLAGHSLLGQIRIPFFGGTIKKNGANIYLDHHYTVNETELYVSAGLGTDNNLNIRAFNKPTINLYRLQKAN